MQSLGASAVMSIGAGSLAVRELLRFALSSFKGLAQDMYDTHERGRKMYVESCWFNLAHAHLA